MRVWVLGFYCEYGGFVQLLWYYGGLVLQVWQVWFLWVWIVLFCISGWVCTPFVGCGSALVVVLGFGGCTT